jgi:hypothetical protein
MDVLAGFLEEADRSILASLWNGCHRKIVIYSAADRIASLSLTLPPIWLAMGVSLSHCQDSYPPTYRKEHEFKTYSAVMHAYVEYSESGSA